MRVLSPSCSTVRSQPTPSQLWQAQRVRVCDSRDIHCCCLQPWGCLNNCKRQMQTREGSRSALLQPARLETAQDASHQQQTKHLPPHGGLNVHCKHHDFCGPVVVTCCTASKTRRVASHRHAIVHTSVSPTDFCMRATSLVTGHASVQEGNRTCLMQVWYLLVTQLVSVAVPLCCEPLDRATLLPKSAPAQPSPCQLKHPDKCYEGPSSV